MNQKEYCKSFQKLLKNIISSLIIVVLFICVIIASTKEQTKLFVKAEITKKTQTLNESDTSDTIKRVYIMPTRNVISIKNGDYGTIEVHVITNDDQDLGEVGTVSYSTSSEDLGAIKIDGNKMIGTHTGTVRIKATVQYNGVTKTSNEITVTIVEDWELTYINTTLYKYDGEELFKYGGEVTDKERQGLYFTNGGGSSATLGGRTFSASDWNKWTKLVASIGDGAIPYFGLAKDELDENGNIQFNVEDNGIFDENIDVGKDVYKNVGLPFVKYGNGFYNFDSSKYETHFENGIPENNVNLTWSEEKVMYQNSTNRYGFFPFNSGDETEDAIYHFGMSAEIPFYMTENGQTSTGEDIIFEFSGDDDIWIFIDGKLVVDIGGVHDEIAADINFANGNIILYKGTKERGIINKTTYLTDILGADWNSDTEKEHKLKVYYLERGKGSSNCQINFNLLTKVQKSDVVVHHYLEGTNEKLAPDETIEGTPGSEYTTTPSQEILNSYEVVTTPDNATGTITTERTEVIYYYKVKDVNIIKNETTKEGTESIDSREDKVSYNLVYEGVIDTYRGEVVVYLEDTLPYKIDTEESELDGGTYDEETNTITWYENIGEIDTLATGENIPETIRVEKNIEVLYKDIDVYQESMVNNIKGVMYLPVHNKTVESEDEYETKIEVKGKVVVKYIDKNNNEEISEQVEKTGRVGTAYDVSEDKKEISGYTLIEEPVVKTGTYTEEAQEKVYYYAKNADVHVTYVDKISKEEIAEDEIITGYEGQKYGTEKKEISGYTFIEDSGNTEGEIGRKRIEVVYYYLYKTKVSVEHRDIYNDGLLGKEDKEGLEGDVYESSPKDFEGYVLVKEPENKTVTMTKEEIVLIYYYSYISGGVIEKHIDEITGEVLEEKTYEGKEGDPYFTEEKNFSGYDLVEEKYPENATGEMARDVIEVKYYYIKKATVRVEYIDKVNDQKLTDDVIINGHENDKYKTEEKEFDGYDLVEIPENAVGEMKITVNGDGTYNTEIVVKYYYKYVSAGVVEKHIDEISGEIITEERYAGYEGDKYETKEKEFVGYDLVKEKYPENAIGTMTREEIEVDYYYIKKATVRVEYIDKYTGNKIVEDVVIEGHEKEPYKTEEKEFEGYEFIEVIGETEGEMLPDEEKVITYYYLRPAEVIVRYLDEETDEPLIEEEILTGYEGDEYVAPRKEIPYYTLSDSRYPENAVGEMKDTIYVTYYYKKKIVDFSIEKTIESMRVDGNKQKITNEDLAKAEVYRKSINNTDIQIVFNIKVTNEGEIKGKVEILEKIPEYLNMSEKDNPGWTVKGEEARYETELIGVGKSKTYKVVMTWKKGDGHFGTQKNIAKIEKVITPAGFDEENLQNNSDESEVIITISTGVEKISGIVIIALVYILAILYMNRKLLYARVKLESENDKKQK